MKLKSLVFILIALIILGGVIWILTKPSGPGKYDTLAQCIADKGVRFYGAWWCPHCRDQKAVFGASAKLLPYIECSPPGQQGPSLPVCADAGIKGYPTWEFADGTREVKVFTLQELADKTSCTLSVAHSAQ